MCIQLKKLVSLFEDLEVNEESHSQNYQTDTRCNNNKVND